NYIWSRAYLTTVPGDEGYNTGVSGGRTIGQAWGRMTYEPDWQSRDFLSVSAVTTDLIHSTTAPYLRPKAETAGGSAVFDFYSPYILVDGLLAGEWSGATVLAPILSSGGRGACHRLSRDRSLSDFTNQSAIP